MGREQGSLLVATLFFLLSAADDRKSFLQTSSVLSRFSDIHGIALVQSVSPLNVLESGKCEEEAMKVEGFVSVQGGHSRVIPVSSA